MANKPDFLRFFRLGLKDIMDRKKLSRQIICTRSGLSNQFVGQVLLGKRDGSEISRRTLADAVETSYEDVIRRGEHIAASANMKAATNKVFKSLEKGA